MSLPGSGCCCGIIVGIVLALLMAAGGTIAVYCWRNPEARRSGISALEGSWKKFKDFGDGIVYGVREIEPPVPPEPKIEISIK
ncbi:MAG: hypothetical protein IJU70_12645 [Lentisphaeria bacterium]|nr:hypothetical protein [Lentisphaeria bacterium]